LALVTAGPAKATDVAEAAPPKASLSLGTTLSYGPRYEGADDGRLSYMPAVYFEYGALFFDTDRGLGLQYLTESGLLVSQSLNYDFGRTDTNDAWRLGSPALRGMGKVSGSATLRTSLVQQLGYGLALNADADVALKSDARRSRFRLGVTWEAWHPESDTLTFGIGSLWGNARYNQSYFGVTATQGASSGKREFIPGPGMHAAIAGLTWEHRFDKHWSTYLDIRAVRYVDTARASPIVLERNACSAMLSTYYTF
jgi:outer membrane protein